MNIKKIHHVAYRCKDAKETVRFYKDVLNMDLLLAIAEDQVPSTKAPDPYIHIFLDAGQGNVLAFFEIPNSPPMGRDENTPSWVQHIAFEIGDMDDLLAYSAALVSENNLVGDVCVDMKQYHGKPLFRSEKIPPQEIPTGPDLDQWTQCLLKSSCVGNPNETAPLMLDQHRLYGSDVLTARLGGA